MVDSGGSTGHPQIAQSLRAANDSVIESYQVGENITGAAFWANAGGGKAHIRWVRPNDDESAFLNALARVAARGELNGRGHQFAGVFRTHGLIAPVFDLDQRLTTLLMRITSRAWTRPWGRNL